MQKMKLHTPNLADENFVRLAALFPNAVTETTDADGKVIRAIDKDVLMQEINCYVVDGKEERYQFTWPDKKKSVLLANAPSTNTLRPCAEESVGRGGEAGGFDSENLYIEGDNLEVLKLLKETYLHKIKMIYIDPPYNTGNDFVYDDDFIADSEEYKGVSGDYDALGNRLVKNLDSNGRFHTDWLNMIYPRLRLAKDLLTDDGVIFMSIDDNEVENLKKVCDEVFGEGNFVANIVWQKRTSPDARLNLGAAHDYILVYAKNLESLKPTLNKLPFNDDRRSNYKNPDNDVRGDWASVDITGQTGHATDSQYYEIKTPSGIKYFPPTGRCWALSQDTFNKLVKDNRIWFGEDGASRPRQKRFLSEMEGINAWTWWSNSEVGHNQEGSKEVKDLLGSADLFTNPKPTRLLKRILQIVTGTSQNSELSTKNSELSTPIILDFFSGSATAAHAVMQLNAENGGNRKFIMVQLPEKCDESSEAFKAGYKNICEIGKERIRRAGKLIIENEKLKDKSSSQNDLFSKDNSQSSTVNSQLDIGFRVLKLDTSNMQEVYYTPQATDQQMLSGMVDNIKPDRTDMDLLFQVMLEYGISLSSKIECKKIDGKDVYFVEDTFLAACFDKAVNDAVVTEIAKAKPRYVALRDMDSDATLTNFEQIFNAISPETVCKVV